MTRIAADAHESGTATARAARAARAALQALQVTAVLSVLALVYQFVTAGEILAGNKSATGLHGDGAIAVHVVFGLMMLAAAAHWRLRRAPVWPTVVAVVVFVISFVQASLGEAGVLAAHVPLALVLTVGVVWVAAWSFTPRARQ